jgi:putative glycosyltransferase (TIGR04372 family)
LGIQATRVGHLAIDPEVAYLHFHQNHQSNSTIWFYFKCEKGQRIANEVLARKWKEILNIGPTWLLQSINLCQELIPLLSTKTILKISISTDYRVLDYSPPLIKFTPLEEDIGQNLLYKLGIKSNQKYICLAVRDGSYLEREFPNKDFTYHNYRDSEISDYIEMANYFIRNGYFVIRMGRINHPIITTHNKFIDYANSQFRSDFADLYLFGNCEFVISTSTGMDRMGLIFRKQIGLVNLPLPQEGEFLGALLRLVMYKDVLDNKTGKVLTLLELNKLMATHRTHLTKNLLNLGLSYKNNSSSELVCFAEEFLNFSDKSSINNYEIEELFLNSGVLKFDTNLRSFRISPDWLAQRI